MAFSVKNQNNCSSLNKLAFCSSSKILRQGLSALSCMLLVSYPALIAQAADAQSIIGNYVYVEDGSSGSLELKADESGRDDLAIHINTYNGNGYTCEFSGIGHQNADGTYVFIPESALELTEDDYVYLVSHGNDGLEITKGSSAACGVAGYFVGRYVVSNNQDILGLYHYNDGKIMGTLSLSTDQEGRDDFYLEARLVAQDGSNQSCYFAGIGHQAEDGSLIFFDPNKEDADIDDNVQLRVPKRHALEVTKFYSSLCYGNLSLNRVFLKEQ